MLGTNPIAVAIPAGNEPAFVADMATTTAANGKLEILQRKNADAPMGWVQDAEGNDVTDANILKKEGHCCHLEAIENMVVIKAMHLVLL